MPDKCRPTNLLRENINAVMKQSALLMHGICRDSSQLGLPKELLELVFSFIDYTVMPDEDCTKFEIIIAGESDVATNSEDG